MTFPLISSLHCMSPNGGPMLWRNTQQPEIETSERMRNYGGAIELAVKYGYIEHNPVKLRAARKSPRRKHKPTTMRYMLKQQVSLDAGDIVAFYSYGGSAHSANWKLTPEKFEDPSAQVAQAQASLTPVANADELTAQRGTAPTSEGTTSITVDNNGTTTHVEIPGAPVHMPGTE